MVPEGFTDDEALNEGRIDLTICATNRFSPDIKVRSWQPFAWGWRAVGGWHDP